jgi:glucan phosphoethanolaminetransferase (alkaline phosphatase superfamily)
MQVLKFLLGIILIQLITVVLIYISPINLDESTSFLRLIFPLFFMALMIAFWFSSLSSNFRKDSEHKMENEFAKEREEFKVKAERANTKVVKQAQKDIAKEATITHAKANFKVGAAFAGVMGIGALFVFAQLLTAGLLTMTAAAGVVGGYYWRGKRIESFKLKELEIIDTKVISQ